MREKKNKGITDKLLNLVYVPKCASCGEMLSDGERVLCRICVYKYDMACHRKCRECGRDICTCDCTKDGIAANGVWRLSKLCVYLPHEEGSPIKAMLYSFKHKNRRDVREFFAERLAELIKRKLPEYNDGYTLCYVPRSLASYREFGYDHMKELSREVSKMLGIPRADMFCRKKEAKTQKELGRAARFKNTESSVGLRPEYKNDGMGVSGRRFILIDDVCVTGASLGRCASLLISEGAIEVRCFVIGVRP